MKKYLMPILFLTACLPSTDQGATNFDECVAEGNPVMESYPRQCRAKNGKTFTEDIGNEMDKMDLIRVNSPRPNSTVSNKINIEGDARGFWFFEGSFPLVLKDSEGNILVQHYATTQDDWMTEEFVEFKTELEVDFGDATEGILILKRDNPSDLPENDDELVIPLRFAEDDKPIDITSFRNPQLTEWINEMKNILIYFDLSSLEIESKEPIKVDNKHEILTGSPFEEFLGELKTKYRSPDGSLLLVVSSGTGSPDSEVLLIDNDNFLERVMFCGTPCQWSGGGWISSEIFFVTGTEEDFGYQGEECCMYQPVLHVFDLSDNTHSRYTGPTFNRRR